MKSNFFMMLICTCFLAISSASATDITFSFQIWKNSIATSNYLGTFTGVTNNANQIVTTSAISQQICPGDQLIIKQYCSKNGAQHSFTGLNGAKATIAITGVNYFSAAVTQIADVCQGTSGCSTAPVHFPSWAWGNTVTITVPAYNSATPFLVFSSSIIGSHVHAHNCGIRTAFIPLNLAPTTAIADQTICPGDAVSIPMISGFTYSNWLPNNPTLSGNAPTTTTNYSVEITHATGCTKIDNFTINVSNPDIELSLPRSLCYDRSIQFTEDDYIDLYNGSTTPLSLTVNGLTIFDFNNNNIFNLPYLIDGPSLGSGTLTFVYTYTENGVTCSKTYEMVIQPEIVLNLQSTYAFCSGNFQPIFATSNGILGQPGITYIWTKTGVPFSVGTGPYFTPSSYGTYHVRAYDEAGCEVRRSFTVYDPGVGIKHPANITFCSMTQRNPSYIGWASDPFGPILYSFNWTYTNQSGTTISIINTGAQYQVPYLGPGTYTTVVNANGCTETISIVVTDLLQVYNNNSNADFSFTPLFGNQVSCQPINSMPGVTNTWTVVDQNGTTISTIPYAAGIRFPYFTGVEYTVTLRRDAPRQCQSFINQFTWLDDFNKNSSNRRDNNSNEDANLNLEATTISTYPNPTTGFVNIQLKDAEAATTSVKVLNALGQIVSEKQVQDQTNIQIDLSKETSGLYLLQIVNGETQFTEKIIKE